MLQLKFVDARRPAVMLVKSRTRVGRSPENDVVIDDPSLTAQHAELLIEQGSVIVVNRAPDAESFVNDERLVGRRLVRAGDHLRLGRVALRLDEAREPEATTFRPATAEWVLVEKTSGRVVAIDRILTVGRLPDCELSIPEECISRRHARIFFDAGVPLVEDLGSTNGTTVNGTRTQRCALKDGDELGFDAHSFRVVHHASAEPRTVLAAAKASPTQRQPTAPADAPPPAPPAAASAEPLQPAAAAPGIVAPAVVAQPKPEKPAASPQQHQPQSPPPDAAATPAEATPRKANWWERHSMGPCGTVFMPAGELQAALPAAAPPPNLEGPVLMGLNKAVGGRRIDIRPGVLVVGRGKERDVTIDDTHVSDPHAQIIFEKATVSVVGFPNCANGTFVNSVRAGGRVFLQSGDVLSFGGVDFQFWLPGGSRRSAKRSLASALHRSPNRRFLPLGIVGMLAVAALIAAVLAYLHGSSG